MANHHRRGDGSEPSHGPGRVWAAALLAAPPMAPEAGANEPLSAIPGLDGQIPIFDVFVHSGADGSAAHPYGVDAGLLLGNGGNGYSPATTVPGFTNGGNGGSAGGAGGGRAATAG